MGIDILLRDGPDLIHHKAYTIRDIIFRSVPQRPDNPTVILGHDEARIIPVTLHELRSLVLHLAPNIQQKGLKKGDTVLLASFYSSNELHNALLFAAFACLGIRIFIPIYPEAGEFDHWKQLTGFKAVIMPYKEILEQKKHEREKDVVRSLQQLCNENDVLFLDAAADFELPALIEKVKSGATPVFNEALLPAGLTTSDEAVIFTTSGTSGKSKLLVYNQGAFSISCQSWQQAGLFDNQYCGNPGFTPLFTHTIGIRNFINALWMGQAACMLVVDWFLQKPEMARYLLLQMKPGHIIGGPALFNMLIEFFRQYPELKSAMKKSLKTVISIGAPYSNQTALQLKSALNLDLLNAFGTTETQLVLLNKDLTETGSVYLGNPLPGVSVKLLKSTTADTYELQLRSPYQASRVLGEENGEDYFSTGDLVQLNADGKLRYIARKNTDFIKDDFGVKIPVTALKTCYPWLYTVADHIEWIPLDKKPGLAALIFLNAATKQYTAKEIAERIKNQNAFLQEQLQPFEYTHRHLERFSLSETELPLTRKGTISVNEILQTNSELISKLKNPYIEEKRIESLDAEPGSLLSKFSNPRLAALLETLKLDVEFEKGERDRLYFRQQGEYVPVLDFVGGFGSGLHGHNHPEIKKALHAFLDSGRPSINTQGSVYHYPSLLARELNSVFSQATGKYFNVQFGNTGSEAMEIALHHAWYEWWLQLEKKRDEQLTLYGSLREPDTRAIWEMNMKRMAEVPAAILVINQCFHGYTASARSLLNNKKQRAYFSGLLRPVPLHINDYETDWKEQIDTFIRNSVAELKIVTKENDQYVVKQEQHCTIIAGIIEPVRGEGGIYETRQETADYLAVQHFPLIADEIQCGLGRTGSLPAYKNAGYYLLGKSLGGGYEKISAVLIDDKRFKPSFPQYYTSTFANGEMAAAAALASLKIIQQENYPVHALHKGRVFASKLGKITATFRDILEPVQGKGLMLGIHFKKETGKNNTLLRILFENELLGYLVAGWLFYNKQIRVLPSLSKPNSIRLEPSVYITEEEMDQFCNALKELCLLCSNGSLYELLRFLLNNDPCTDRTKIRFNAVFPNHAEEPAPGALRAGFIGNFTNPPKELMLIEPDLQQASETGLRILFSKMQTLLEGKPVRLFSKNLMNGRIHFSFYILPFDTSHLEIIHRWGKKRWYNARIQEAVNLLAAEGATQISLGAHTSILSGNGLYLAEPAGVKILTGNTLTVASCVYHAAQYYHKQAAGPDNPRCIAIAGANGNIGSGVAACFSHPDYASARILLVGNNLKKLELLRKKNFSTGQQVICSTDLFSLQQADIIISCTNTNDPLIFPHHIHPHKNVFIIDIAVPGSVAEEVKRLEHVQFCKEASSVYLPDDPDFIISTHTAPGKIFCCAGEVMLSVLYDVQLPLKGHVQPESVRKMMELAMAEDLFNKKVYAATV